MSNVQGYRVFVDIPTPKLLWSKLVRILFFPCEILVSDSLNVKFP